MLPTPGIFTRASLGERAPTLWRYREALGIENPSNIVTLGEGFTPLVDCFLNGQLKLKLDFLCPTGSYKDRGSAVMISKLKEWGVTELISTLR